MKIIPLTQGKTAFVDDEDFEKLAAFNWYAYKKPYQNRIIWYAGRHLPRQHEKQRTAKMHREILGVSDPKIQVDHRNGNGLDNQKSNLRQAVCGQNQQNMRKHVNCSSKFKGVYWHNARNKWAAKIMFAGISHWLGLFTSEKDAAAAYDKAAKRFFGDFSLTNKAAYETR